MATYYVRADGNSGGMKNAFGPPSIANACGNVDHFNSFTFSAGDVIYWSGLGGPFVDFTLVGSDNATMHLRASGSAGSPIVIKGIDGAIIEAEADAHIGIFCDNHDFVEVSGFALTNGGAAGASQFIRVIGTAGSGDLKRATVIFNDIMINGAGGGADGDGVSLAESAWVECNRVEIRNLVGGASEQAVTTHGTSRLDFNDGRIENCNLVATTVDASTLNLNNTAIRNPITAGLAVGSGQTDNGITMTGGSYIDNLGTASLMSSAGSDQDARLIIQEANIELRGAGATGAVTAPVFLLNNTILIDQATGNLNLNSAGTATPFVMTGNTISLYTCGTNGFLNASPTSGDHVIRIEGNTINYLGTAGGELLLANKAGQIVIFAGNIVDGRGNATNNQSCIRVENMGASAQLCNNTVVNFDGGTTSVFMTRDNTIVVENNILHNVTGTASPFQGLGGTSPASDYNVYSGTTTDVGDANSITDDPLFVSEARYDYELQAGSPAASLGNKWFTRPPEDTRGNPLPAYGINAGAIQ